MGLLSDALTNTKFVGAALREARLRRHLLWWLRSQQRDYLLDAPCPWLAFDAILALRERMRPGMRVFEYGSGGSTLFWLAQGAAQVVSVEHNPGWYRMVAARVTGKPQADLRLVLPEPVTTADLSHDPADPALYLSDDEDFRGCSFRGYVCQIDAFPDASFDILLVDGRARPACIAHGAAKVKAGGMLVLDNADRGYYLARTGEYLAGFRREVFAGMTPRDPVLSTTAIFTRRT